MNDYFEQTILEQAILETELNEGVVGAAAGGVLGGVLGNVLAQSYKPLKKYKTQATATGVGVGMLAGHIGSDYFELHNQIRIARTAIKKNAKLVLETLDDVAEETNITKAISNILKILDKIVEVMVVKPTSATLKAMDVLIDGLDKSLNFLYKVIGSIAIPTGKVGAYALRKIYKASKNIIVEGKKIVRTAKNKLNKQ